MFGRIRKSMEERDGGFTLIELLVVMIIIGILAAVGIPIFLSQRAKARDTSTKADVSVAGKEVATYYVDHAPANAFPAVAIAGGRITFGGADIGAASPGTAVVAQNGNGTVATPWCVEFTNPDGDLKNFSYSADAGLQQAAC